jgi:ABC-type Zn uptake system ZnuABC Zn-binding protein ZnuA
VAAQAVARELGARLEVLDPLDSEASSVGKTYLERVRHDVKVLAQAVAGETPAVHSTPETK